MKPRLASVIATLVILGIALFALPWLAHFYVDLRWFQALGHADVLTTPLLTQIGLGVATAIATFALIGLSLSLVVRHTDERQGFMVQLPDGSLASVGRPATRLRWPVAAICGVFVGLAASGLWRPFLLFVHGSAFGREDPIFHRDIAFYMFRLPLLDAAFSLFVSISVLSLIATLALMVARGSIRLDRERLHASPSAAIHLAVLTAVLFAVLAFGAWLETAHLVLDQRGLIAGAGYADVHARLPAIRAHVAVAAVGAVLVLVAGFRRQLRFVLAAVGLYVVVGVVGRGLLGAAVQTYVVEPNEFEREKTFIEHEITATRAAFGLDKVDERELSGDLSLSRANVEANRATIDNVRLWDHRPLLDTFGQIQEIRTYYEFASVDNDRYVVDGQLRQTMLSPRELVSESLPNRTWINEHFTFTHGYGITLGPVNRATEEGLPELFVQDIPPESTVSDFKVERPGIYFGERTTNYAFVRTRAREFDHPSAQNNVYSEYQGDGGVTIDSPWLRASLALYLRNFKVLLSADLKSDSRILMHREIRERIGRLAPFLTLDQDPYMVVRDDGTLAWICDAYTTSGRYPYARRAPGSRVNYMRNSVKVVVDAYHGSVQLYAFDPSDPLLQTWQRVFPDLFTPADQLPPDLRAHLRYPLDIFQAQSSLLATFHMDSAELLYNREDQWQVPSMRRGTTTSRMEPYYTVMRLPGEEAEEFILMLPFTPARKENLAAWLVARSDGDRLGELRVYRFPNDRLVFGPRQVLNRINQDAEISAQLSLWDQRGSQAVLGTLLVIPIEESLIYALPLYLRSEGGRIPQLKRVIVVYQNQIAMRETLEAAVDAIFPPAREQKPAAGGEAIAATTATGEPSVAAATQASAAASPNAARALSLFRAAVEAQRQGDWGAYGRHLEELERVLLAIQP